MTTGFALALAAVPTLAGLALLGLADPKRRRTAGDGAAPGPWRFVGSCLLAAAACIALAAGIAALLVWFAAAAAAGWGLTHGLAMAPASTRFAAEAVLRARPSARRLKAALASAWRPKRSATGRLAVVLALVALATSALWSWRAAERADRLVGSIAALDAVDLLSTRDPERAAMRPCWRMLGRAKPEALRDLLSDRAMTLALAGSDGDGPGEDLQRCVLAQGGEGTVLVRVPGRTEAEVTLDTAVVAALHAAAVRRLLADETLAELAEESETARRLICRHARDAGETGRVVAILREDRDYAKSADLLDTLPLLDRPAEAPSLCSP